MHISKKLSVAIHCLILVSEFGDEMKLTSEMMAASTGCNPVIIRNIVSSLKKAGMVSVKSGTGGTTLNCSPKDIDLYKVCMAIEPVALEKLIGIHSMPSPLCPVGKNINAVLSSSYEQVQTDIKNSLASITLDSIIVQYHNELNS